MPPDVENLFDELKAMDGARDVEDEDAGIRLQYQGGVLEKDDVKQIVASTRRLKQLYEKGIWTP